MTQQTDEGEAVSLSAPPVANGSNGHTGLNGHVGANGQKEPNGSNGYNGSNGHNGSSSKKQANPQGRPKVSCPVCLSKDRLDKVSSIVRQGRGRLVWDNGEVAHYETELSELLDDPQPPKRIPLYKPLLDSLPALLVLAAVLAVLAGLRAQTYTSVPLDVTELTRNVAIAWFAVLIPAAAIVRYILARFAQRKERIAWAHAHRRWGALYYCSRDDIVFAPTLKMIASPAEMSSLLYPAESITNERLSQLAAGGLWEVTTTSD